MSAGSSSDGLEFEYRVQLVGGPPWGFRIAGGQEYSQDIRISYIKPGDLVIQVTYLVVTGDLVIQVIQVTYLVGNQERGITNT